MRLFRLIKQRTCIKFYESDWLLLLAGEALSPHTMHRQTPVIINPQISWYDCYCHKTMTDRSICRFVELI